MPPKENDNVYWCRNIVWRCAFCQAETEHVVHHCVKSQASKASVGPPLCLHQSVPHCQPCWPKSNDKYIKCDHTIKTLKGDWICDLIFSQDYVLLSTRKLRHIRSKHHKGWKFNFWTNGILPAHCFSTARRANSGCVVLMCELDVCNDKAKQMSHRYISRILFWVDLIWDF